MMSEKALVLALLALLAYGDLPGGGMAGAAFFSNADMTFSMRSSLASICFMEDCRTAAAAAAVAACVAAACAAAAVAACPCPSSADGTAMLPWCESLFAVVVVVAAAAVGVLGTAASALPVPAVGPGLTGLRLERLGLAGCGNQRQKLEVLTC
jgi:hypothetical protein